MIKKFFNILSPKQRRQFYSLLLLNTLVVFFQLLGVTSIFPFMEVASKDGIPHQNALVNQLSTAFDIDSKQQIILVLGVIIVLLLLISNFLTVYTFWRTNVFSWSVFDSLQSRLLNKYFKTNYSFFSQINTAGVLTSLTSEVRLFCVNLLVPVLKLFASLMLGLALSIVLFIMEPKVTLVAYLLFLGFYTILFTLKKTFLKEAGAKFQKYDRQRYQTITESLNGIKTLKIYGLENDFLKRFSRMSTSYSAIPPKVDTLEFFPKYILELFAFSGIIVVVVYYSTKGEGLNNMLPILSLYAFAGYKLIPAFQNIFSLYSKIFHSSINLEIIHNQLFDDEFAEHLGDESLSFNSQLEIKNLSFKHLGASDTVLRDINLLIPKGKSIALIGSTGSGKTTLLDLITGLLKPTSGQILVDSKELNDSTIKNWQSQISYVPQHIFLYDDTVEKNICISTPSQNSRLTMEESAKIAQIHDFIESQPKGYQTMIGQNGVKLSGGQRQRLGLARAIYRGTDLLILDESTNALDKVTETEVLKSLKQFNPNLTLIIITHRIDTVKDVDEIYILKDGVIEEKGSFEELIQKNEEFKLLATTKI